VTVAVRSSMQKKRVLYIIEELSLGGAERVVVELARRIDRRRFEPYVCCLREKGAMAGDLKAANVPVLEMHKRRSIDLRMLGRLCRAIRRLKIDIVHTHLFTANAWGRLAARLAGVPRIVASEHSVDESRDGLRLLVDRALAACTDTVIAKADAVADFCRRRIGVNGGKLRVVPNGVDVSQYSRASRNEVRREMGVPENSILVATVGRLAAEKDHANLLRALAHIRKTQTETATVTKYGGPVLFTPRTLTGPRGEDPERAESREDTSAIRRIEPVLECSGDSSLAGEIRRTCPDESGLVPVTVPEKCELQLLTWIVGDGPLEEELKKEAGKLGIDESVRFLGARDDVPRLLAASDIFVISSRREGMPLSLLEAMASGLAVIVTAVGGCTEVVRHGHNGVVVPPAAPRALARAIVELAGDAQRRAELGRNALKTAREKFSLQEAVRTIEEIYLGNSKGDSHQSTNLTRQARSIPPVPRTGQGPRGNW